MGQFITTKKVLKAHLVKIILASLCILLFMGLKFWDYYAPLPIHDWNNKEISRVKVADPEDFAFAVLGDNKGNYFFFEPLLHDIDHNAGIDFAIDVGDLVSEGGKGKYRHFLNQVQENLAIPFLTAIGNHDLNNGSSDNYLEIFGPTYYTFQIGQSYFIILDATTESGFDKPERQWLEDELQKAQTSKARFIFMHVPPFDPRGSGFNKCLPEKDRKDLLDLFRRYKVSHLFASHIHGYFSDVWEGVPYTITGGAGGGLQGSDPQHFFHHYIKVHVHDGKVDTTVQRVEAKSKMVYLFEILEDRALEWALLIGVGISLVTLVLSARNRRSS
jgi:3',5'-cyclic AMP phosphodiesterase CpdA